MNFYIKALTLNELDAYKRIRLQALKTDPQSYCNSFEKEASMSQEAWVQRISNPEGIIFGLYHAEELIGITAILIEEHCVGHLTHSYIQKQYRGLGLSKQLFTARMQWAKEKGVQKLIINHRKNNLASKAAIQSVGFRFTHSGKITLASGLQDEVFNYELVI
ncbi:MAG: GNAT family N-acetyltransferase [Niabella sp.]